MVDFTAPTVGQIEEFLSYVDSARDENKVCWNFVQKKKPNSSERMRYLPHPHCAAVTVTLFHLDLCCAPLAQS